MGLVSERNGVPVSPSRWVAGSKASRIASPHDRLSPPWWISSRMTSVGAALVRARCNRGLRATRVGHGDTVELRAMAPRRVGEVRVNPDADPRGRIGPLCLEVLGRRDNGDPADQA